MNEEEKELLDSLKYLYEKDKEVNRYATINYSIPMYPNKIKKTINLIDKQQKEIERLKDEYKREVFEHQEFVEDTKVAVQDYIKKDKIKEKIKELESHTWKDGYMTKFDKYAIHYLKELLGE